MRSFFLILFLLPELFSSGQGFERFLSDEIRVEVTGMKMINDSIIELNFQGNGGMGSGTRYLKAWYFINQDSLGTLYTFFDATFPGSYDFIRTEDGTLLNYYNNSHDCRSQYYLNMRVLDFNNAGYHDFPKEAHPFIAGSYNHLYLNDSLFGYHGKNFCYEQGHDLSQNNKLYYYYYNYRTGSITYLDTISLPFTMREGASLLRHPKTGQNILFYDSLKIYMSPGSSSYDSIISEPSIWVKNGERLYANNLDRHYAKFTYSRGQIRFFREVLDTLDAEWVTLVVDWFDSLYIKPFRRLAGYEDYWPTQGSVVPCLEDSIDVYKLDQSENYSQRILLLALRNGELLQERTFIPGPTRTMHIKGIGMDSQGNFYLAGILVARPYIGRYYNDPNRMGFKRNVIIKIDSTGYSREMPSQPKMSLQTGQDAISFKIDDPFQEVDYRVLGLGGKVYKEGREVSGAWISINSLNNGLYYFQVWSSDGALIGQEPFVKN